MLGLGAGRNGLGQRLGVAGSGKAAYADIDTVGNQGGCPSAVMMRERNSGNVRDLRWTLHAPTKKPPG
jgi:hypothetical protein